MQTADLKVKAIVTRAVPYNESDMIVTLVGVETGKITATAKGCLKPKAKLRYAAEPMNFGDYVLTGRNGRYVITECSQIESFSAITTDIDRYYAASLTLEVLQKLSIDSQPDLFIHALETLNNLAYTDKEPDVIVTDFCFPRSKTTATSLTLRIATCASATSKERRFSKTRTASSANIAKDLTVYPSTQPRESI